MGIPIFFCKESSPNVDGLINGACHVESDGYVYGSYWNLGDSYGKDNSPYHPYDHSSWYILHIGMVNFNSEVNYSKSYGMIYTTNKKF